MVLRVLSLVEGVSTPFLIIEFMVVLTLQALS